MKFWQYCLIGFGFILLLAGAFFAGYKYAGAEARQTGVTNDSLAIAAINTDLISDSLAALKKSEALRVPFIDSLLNIKYEPQKTVFSNNDFDSLHRENIRAINRLDKKRRPY